MYLVQYNKSMRIYNKAEIVGDDIYKRVLTEIRSKWNQATIKTKTVLYENIADALRKIGWTHMTVDSAKYYVQRAVKERRVVIIKIEY